MLVIAHQTQGKNNLNQHVFLSCEINNDITPKLNAGYRAFLVSGNAKLEAIFSDSQTFLEENQGELIVFIFKQATPQLSTLFATPALQKLTVSPNSYSLNQLSEIKKADKGLLIFTPEVTAFSFSFKQNICEFSVATNFPENINQAFKGDVTNDLVVFNLDTENTILVDSLEQNPELIPQLFNNYTGKLPNFFVTKQLGIYHAYFQYFEKQTWYSANVEYEGKILSEISWEQLPHLISLGKIHTTSLELSPKKEGFRFSPDVFTFNNHTSKSTKLFYATQLNLTDELVLLLNFNQNAKNEIKTETPTSYSQIKYIKNEERDWCADFNGREDYIDFDTDIDFQKNFTVSAWVKPRKINGNRSILGKGKALSIKIKDGHLLFTSPGIMDHLSDSAVVTLNEWQLLTYVISAEDKVLFYRNSVLVGMQEAAPIMPTDHSLLIGTNLWDESFDGLMDELAIWNRTLSHEEIQKLYTTGLNVESNKSFTKYVVLLASLLILFIVLIVIKALGKNKSSIRTNTKLNFNKPNFKPTKTPYIKLFGGFKLVNRNNEDLTKRFSPKRKQIFILVLIETLKSNGISSKQLTDKLWAGYSTESAKNNRSTQVQRIREILKLNSGISIDYENKLWVLNFEDDIYCDLAECFRLSKDFSAQNSKQVDLLLLKQLLQIIEKGALLPNMEDEWLDHLKSEVSDNLLEQLLPLVYIEEISNNAELLLRLSNALMIYDSLNEPLLQTKIAALIKLGKTTQAQESLEHFSKVYQQCYNEAYGKSISDILKD